MIPTETQSQVDGIVVELNRILAAELVGVYLHGSLVLGGFGPRSDIDVVVVTSRPTTDAQKRRIADVLLETSGACEPPGRRRPIELDLLVQEDIRPWRHPAPFDFSYGESLRERFAAGEVTPWEHSENRDLAAHVTVLHHAGVVLAGPPIADVFPPIPVEDYRDALMHDLDWCRDHAAERPRYMVLSLARMWATLAEGQVHSKESGAEWAKPRLPDGLKPVLEHGLEVYRGRGDDVWDSLDVEAYAHYVTEEIEATRPR